MTKTDAERQLLVDFCQFMSNEALLRFGIPANSMGYAELIEDFLREREKSPCV